MSHISISWGVKYCGRKAKHHSFFLWYTTKYYSLIYFIFLPHQYQSTMRTASKISSRIKCSSEKNNDNRKTKKVRKLETTVMTHLPKKKWKKFYIAEYIQKSPYSTIGEEDVICSFFILLVILGLS